MKRFSLCLLFCLFLFAASSSYAASGSAGEVAAIRGKAEASGSDKPRRQLSLKSQVYSGDILITGPKARLQVIFNDNSIISMGPDSEVTISEYSLKEKGGSLKTNIREGAFHIMGGSIAKDSPENFVTETPYATIGIRGSMFALNVKGKKLSVVFLGGKGIDVFNSAGSVAITNPGFGTIVTDVRTVPEPPRSFAGDELQGIVDMARPGEKSDSDAMDENPSQEGGKDKHSKEDEPRLKKSPSDLKGIKPPGQKPPGSFQPGLKPVVPGAPVILNPTAIPQNIINTNVENKLNLIVQEQRIATRGIHQSVIKPESEAADLVKTSDSGIVEANLLKGHVEGFIQDQTGVKSGFSFNLPDRDPSAPYSGFLKLQNVPAKRIINGVEEYPENMTIGYSSTGTFLIFGLDNFGFLRNTDRFLYSELGFTGVKALQDRRFSDGISVFSGPAIGFAKLGDSGIQKADDGTGDMKVMVNWHNNKIFGLVSGFRDNDLSSDGTLSTDIKVGVGEPVIIMGDISPDRAVVENAVAFGYYLPSDEISINKPQPLTNADILSGSQSQATDFWPIVWLGGDVKGEFYGSRFDGFGFRAEGDLVKIQSDQANTSGKFQITAAGFRDTGFAGSSSGTTPMNGFAVGIAEDMSMPGKDTRFFINSNPADFSMELDRDTGNLKGVLSAGDSRGSGSRLSSLEMGGANVSAYVDDTHFGAVLGGQDSIVSPGGSVSGPKPYGNYIVTDLGGKRLAEYTSWGYWEMSYSENRQDGTTRPYHIHRPGALWIAGEMTPEERIDALRQTGFKGAYEGKAIGVWYGDVGGYGGAQTGENLSGITKLNLDLSPGAKMPVKGEINFAEKNVFLGFQADKISGSSFTGKITNSQAGSVNGAFFGPNAESAAGSFGAKVTDGSIMGVFGANRSQLQ